MLVFLFVCLCYACANFPEKDNSKMDVDTFHPGTTIATGPHSMSPDIDLEVGQVPQATPRDRVFFSLSHHCPFWIRNANGLRGRIR